MNHKIIQNKFILILLAVALILSFFILRPFINVIVLACAFAVVFQPIYQKLLVFVNKKSGLAAALATFVVFILLFTPLILLATQITQEASTLYGYITDSGGGDKLIAKLNDVINKFSPGHSIDVNQYARQALNWLLPNLYSLFSNSARIVLDAFIFFFALYYLFKDGHKLKNILVKMSPLLDIDDEMLFKKIGTAINTVIIGNLTIAIIQGIVTIIGFLIFGVPNATLWGSATVIAALIPGIGTALILIPAIAFLVLTGELLSAAGLTIWGIAAVGTIDNFLGPRIMGKGTNLHPLLVFLAVLGGIAFFGPMGILLGPIIISLLIALFDLYSLRVDNQL